MYMANALDQRSFALGQGVFALGPQSFSDTDMLVSAMQKSRVGGITQREDPTQRGLCCGGI